MARPQPLPLLCMFWVVALWNTPCVGKPVTSVGGPVNAAKRMVDEGDAKPLVASRMGAFLGSPEEISNCHSTPFNEITDTQMAADLRAALEKHHEALQNGAGALARVQSTAELKFCYFTFVVDDFSLLGTMHRPALSQPAVRALGTNAFGATSSFMNPQALIFGDPKERVFVDAQGYVIHPVEGKPFFRMMGHLKATVNTRPLTENQIIDWKILYSKTGQVDAAVTLQQGEFTVFRKSKAQEESVLMNGKVEIDPIDLQGFESGWVGVWFRIRHTQADPTAAKKSAVACSDFETIVRYDAGKGKVCGMSEVPLCNPSVNARNAYYTCTGFGARLCTVTEIKQEAGVGSGCNMDNMTIWTSTECVMDDGSDGFEVLTGDPALAAGAKAQHCRAATATAAVRCCGDTVDLDGAQKSKFLTLNDNFVVLDFAEPPHLEKYEAAKAKAAEDIIIETGKPAPTPAPPPKYEKKEQPVAYFDFFNESLASLTLCTTTKGDNCIFPFLYDGKMYEECTDVNHNAQWCATAVKENRRLLTGDTWGDCGAMCQGKNAPAAIIDLNAQCNGRDSNFVDSVVFGEVKKVLRWEPGTGLVIPNLDTVMDTDHNTHFTLSLVVKFDTTSCYTRVLNINPGEDNGVYLCDGLAVTPEIPAGHPFVALKWHHIIISTNSNRETKLYHNGRLLRSWTLGKTTWNGALRVKHKDMVLFNDCGHMCRCDSVENTGGWVSSIELYNHQVDDDVADMIWRRYSENGLVAHYDFRLGHMESEVEGAPDLVEIGASCETYTRNILDPNLMGRSTYKTRYVWPGTGLYLPLDGVISTYAYSIIMKVKLPNVNCKGMLFSANPVYPNHGLYVCDALLIHTDSDYRFGPMLNADTWHTIALSTSIDRRVQIYVDNMRVKHIEQMNEAEWEKVFMPYGFDSFSFFTSANKECDDSSENIEAILAQMMVFNRELTYDEVQVFGGLMGSEVQTTINPEHFGGTAPVGTTCTFPFVKFGVEYTECVSAINWCKTSGDILEEDFYGSYEWGYCSKGAGYRRHEKKSLPVGTGDLGACRGGVLGCQKKCDENYDCIGFVIDECSVNEVDRNLLLPLEPHSSIREYKGSTIIKAGGTTGGAIIKNHPVTVGETYLLIAQATQPKPGATLYAYDSEGDLADEFPPLEIGIVTKSTKFEFTARTDRVAVGIRFTDADEHDVVTVAAIDLPTVECEYTGGHMASGMLKGLWVDSFSSETHSIYQKLRTGPLSDVDMSTLKNKLLVSASVTDYGHNGKHMGSLEDMGEGCNAGNNPQVSDTLGSGASMPGFAVERDIAFGSPTGTSGPVYIAECMGACADDADCKGVSWDSTTQDCTTHGDITSTTLSVGTVSGRKRSEGAQYIRITQVGVNLNRTLPWTIREVQFFEDLDFTVQIPVVGATSSGGDNPEFVSDDKVANTWTGVALTDESVTLDLGESKVAQALYLRSDTNWPRSLLIEESLDGTTWARVSVLNDVVEEYSTLLFGVLGGRGGDPENTFRIKRGTGLSMSGICELMPCEDDVAYSILLHANMDFPAAPQVEDGIAIATGVNRTSIAHKGRWINSKVEDTEDLEQETVLDGMTVEQLRWSRVAVAVNVGGSEIYVNTAEDLVQPTEKSLGKRPVVGGRDPMVISSDHPLMFYSDAATANTCSSAPDLSTGLITHISVFDRELTPTEMQFVGDSLRWKCGGSDMGECYGNGYCKEGICVCGLDAEGDLGLCEDRICPGRMMRTQEGQTFAGSYPQYETGNVEECSGIGSCNKYTGECTCEWYTSTLHSDYQKDCAQDDLYIECDGYIHIITARYGVYQGDMCGDFNFTACYYQTSRQDVTELCEGQRSCTISLAGVGAAACPGQDMLLQVGWSCRADPDIIMPPTVGVNTLEANARGEKYQKRFGKDCSLAMPLWYEPITEVQKTYYPHYPTAEELAGGWTGPTESTLESV